MSMTASDPLVRKNTPTRKDSNSEPPVLLVKWLVNLLLEKYLKLEFSSRVLGDVVVDPLKPKKAVEVAEK